MSQKKMLLVSSIKQKDVLFGLIGTVIVLLVWTTAHFLLGNARVPSPWHMAQRFVNTILFCPEIRFQGAGSKGFSPHVVTTLFRYLGGTLLGIFLSFVCLFFTIRFKIFKDLFSPIIDILRTIPPLAISPFLLLWFGTNPISIIGVIVFYTFVMIYVAGIEAVDKLDPSQIDFARTLGAKKTTIVFEVIIPALLPAMSGPIKVASCWSWGLVLVGEMLGAKTGIGRINNSFIALTATDLVMVGIIWILLLAVVMEKFIVLILKQSLKWNKGMDS